MNKQHYALPVADVAVLQSDKFETLLLRSVEKSLQVVSDELENVYFLLSEEDMLEDTEIGSLLYDLSSAAADEVLKQILTFDRYKEESANALIDKLFTLHGGSQVAVLEAIDTYWKNNI